jgi:hypothetical protein
MPPRKPPPPVNATAPDLTARVTTLEESVRLLTARLDTLNDRPAGQRV